MGTTTLNNGGSASSAALTAGAVDLAAGVAGALSGGGTQSLVEGAEAAAEETGSVIETITGLKAKVSSLEDQIAKYEATHPVVLGIVSVLNRLFPSEIGPLQAILTGHPALQAPADPNKAA